MSRAALLAAAAVALLVAGCVACAWIEGAPLVPADAGRADGGRLGIVFLALLVAAFAAYLVGLALLRRRPPGLRAVLLVAVAIQVVPLAGPLLLSTDAWTYWEYGRIAAVHDGNPYVDVPSDYPDDPSYEYAGAAWRDTTSVYGPLFTSVSGARRSDLGLVRRGRGLDLQDDGGARRARVRPPRRQTCDATGRTPRRSSAGIRSSRSTSPAAATTTRS